MIIYLVNFSFDDRHRAQVVHVKTAAFAFQITKRINIIVLAHRDIRVIIARQVNIYITSSFLLVMFVRPQDDKTWTTLSCLDFKTQKLNIFFFC